MFFKSDNKYLAMTTHSCSACGKQFASEEALSHHAADAHGPNTRKKRQAPYKRLSLPAIGLVLTIVLVLGGGITLGLSGAFTADTGSSQYTAFAQCLDSENATMYGAYWCPHCKEQKERFEGAFNTVDYVECDPKGDNPQPQLCKQKGIQSYPTWIYQGERRTGALSLEQLSSWTGCELQQK